MLTKITSKGRFWILGTGLFVIAAYLSLALASNNSATFARTNVIEKNEHVEKTNDHSATVAETNSPSTQARHVRSEGPLSKSRVSANQVNEDNQDQNKSVQIQIVEDNLDVDVDKVEKTSSQEPVSFKVQVDNNPLAPSIDPDTPGIARTAVAADFESLMESGIDVSNAVRHIDERVTDGKYGQNVIRK